MKKIFSLHTLPFWRRLIQVLTALAFILIPILNLCGVDLLHGNFLAFRAWSVPLGDPLAALQVVLGGFSATQTMLTGAGLTLLLALFMGPVFCSWLCPFGLFSELIPKRRGKERPGLFPLKAAIVLAGLMVIIFFYPGPILNQLSLPGWYSRAMQHAALYGEALWPAALLPAALALDALSGGRVWCGYICPQSVLLALAGLILPPRLQVRFHRAACTCPARSRPCLKACSLYLNPRAPGLEQKLRCTNCGDCVSACARHGRALRLDFGKKIR
ncbi:MAG: 4Fe-4S binding protein [Deltaproteobacteria bacterium]|jgi:ferredoxin-type protein NapH|nr:4Fe-4S binding protein [Deltaproteobacteria bacterium]